MEYLTEVIFQNNKIFIDTSDNENHKVIAKEDIAENELLLIEHLIENDNANKIINYIAFNEILFNNLYPRNIKFDLSLLSSSPELPDSIKSITSSKAEKNLFQINQKDNSIYYTIGLIISNFNHSLNNNANAYIDYMLQKNKGLCYATIMSNSKISKGDEITIHYGFNLLYEEDYKPYNALEHKNPDYVVRIAKNYMKKPRFLEIYENQTRADNGIYYCKEGCIITNPELKSILSHLI